MPPNLHRHPDELSCPYCRRPLPPDHFNTQQTESCPACGSRVQTVVFPAFYRQTAPAGNAEPLLADSDAGCFYHPAKKAAVVCDACGRFLCALCNIDFAGRHLCPACLEQGGVKTETAALDNTRTLYDSMALMLALLSLVICYLGALTAPAALFLAIYHWKTPSSLLHRTKARHIAAILLSLLILAGYGVALAFISIRS